MGDTHAARTRLLAPALPRSPPIVLTVLLASGAVASRLGPCEKLLPYGKVVTSSRVADQHLWHTFHSCHVQQSCSITSAAAFSRCVPEGHLRAVDLAMTVWNLGSLLPITPRLISVSERFFLVRDTRLEGRSWSRALPKDTFNRVDIQGGQ